jgi:hypothetical protein
LEKMRLVREKKSRVGEEEGTEGGGVSAGTKAHDTIQIQIDHHGVCIQRL